MRELVGKIWSAKLQVGFELPAPHKGAPRDGEPCVGNDEKLGAVLAPGLAMNNGGAFVSTWRVVSLLETSAMLESYLFALDRAEAYVARSWLALLSRS